MQFRPHYLLRPHYLSPVHGLLNEPLPFQDTITFVDMEPCDAEQMRAPLSETPAGLVLEMTDVGRGDGVPTDLFKVGHVEFSS